MTARKTLKAPSFRGLEAASASSTRAKRASSPHTGTKPEIVLRQALSERGLRFRENATHLPGKPDIVFTRGRVAVFCDGDFWHGRNWRSLRRKLKGGTNAAYWIAKIQTNMQRDLRINAQLEALGWKTMRLWESDIRADVVGVAQTIERVVVARTKTRVKGQANTDK